jgi:CRISPR system Cascade subunit CasB
MDAASERETNFVNFLYELAKEENRGALAALRRGLGKDPGTVFEMYPYVAPFLSPQDSSWCRSCYFVIASLFAYHPLPGGSGNLGTAMGLVYQKNDMRPSIEQRFIALLNSHPDDLFDHLRYAVSLAKSEEIPINWQSLLHDIVYWNSENRYVQRRWAASFWNSEELKGEDQ